MNKQDMIKEIKSSGFTWGDVYTAFNRRITSNNQMPSVNGWHHAFDGPSIDEMYLTNAHPCSDEPGDIITKRDYDGLEQIKPVVIGYWHIFDNSTVYPVVCFGLCDKEHATWISIENFKKGIKSKFRPVYKKEG